MAKKKLPRFKSETQEDEWCEKNQDFIADRFEKAKPAGKLGRGTVAGLGREPAGQSGPSPMAVAEKLSTLRTEEYFRERAARANIKKAKQILKRAGKGTPPVPADER